jgi:hypothetical protein
MIGEAARRHPELARDIVARGHEAAGLIAVRYMVEAATGQRPVGYNCNWLPRGPNTLSLLQELGYLYHIDDVSRDEERERSPRNRSSAHATTLLWETFRLPAARTSVSRGTLVVGWARAQANQRIGPGLAGPSRLLGGSRHTRMTL